MPSKQKLKKSSFNMLKVFRTPIFPIKNEKYIYYQKIKEEFNTFFHSWLLFLKKCSCEELNNLIIISFMNEEIITFNKYSNSFEIVSINFKKLFGYKFVVTDNWVRFNSENANIEIDFPLNEIFSMLKPNINQSVFKVKCSMEVPGNIAERIEIHGFIFIHINKNSVDFQLREIKKLKNYDKALTELKNMNNALRDSIELKIIEKA